MQATTDSRPVHRVFVDGFWMDETEVTNEQFARFVKATGYVTRPSGRRVQKNFPARRESLVPGSIVFSLHERPSRSTIRISGGLTSTARTGVIHWGRRARSLDKEQYPVVQVTYADALAYAQWAGKRLPTEAEWEFAARGGMTGKLFPWGDEFRTRPLDGQHLSGHFPDHDSGEDAFTGIAPVAQFPPNGYGLYDVAGNVWEWVSDWYRPDYYARLVDRCCRPQPARPDRLVRSRRTRREETRASRWLVSLHGSVLLPLHGWHEGQRRHRNRHEPSRIPLRESVVIMNDGLGRCRVRTDVAARGAGRQRDLRFPA